MTTDASGVYSLWLRTPGLFAVTIGQEQHSVFVTNDGLRGDLLADAATCVSRYGRIVDAETGLAVAGASVRGGRHMRHLNPL